MSTVFRILIQKGGNTLKACPAFYVTGVLALGLGVLVEYSNGQKAKTERL